MTFIDQVLLAFLAILPVVNPFSTPPIFISITEGLTSAERRVQALKASVYAFIILLVSFLAGTLVLRFFSISLPAVQIAGGLVIARTGFEMLRPQRTHHQTPEEETESRAKEDISFVPLAMPLLSGPGAIALMINLATSSVEWVHWVIIPIGALLVCIVTYIILIESTRLDRFLGVNGMNALTKLMGFLLLALAVQFIINGVSGVLTTLVHTLNAAS